MKKNKIDPKDNSSNQQNSNTGTKGTNKAWDDAQKNRNKQLQKKK